MIKPRGKYVLVKPDEKANRKNENGIIIPSNVEQEQKSQGDVIAVGDVKDIKKGDKVIYGTYCGELLKVIEKGKEVEYRLLLDEDIIAFIC